MKNEDFFYEGAERGDLLDALNGHAHEGATTVLEGEPGSGVSTLLGMLSMSLIGDFELIRLDGAENLSANAVVDAMLVHFEVERAELADTLKQALADSRLIVVVDNAGQLPEAALATMVSLKQKLAGRLVFVFGGRPGTADRLAGSGLAVADSMTLLPLTAEQVAAFADEALAVDLSLSEAEELRLDSGGQPGPLLQHLEERHRPAASAALSRRAFRAFMPVPLRHGLAVGALVLVVLVLWLASGDAPEEAQVVTLTVPNPPSEVTGADNGAGNSGADSSAGNGEKASGAPADAEPDLVSTVEQTRRALLEYNPTANAFQEAETQPLDHTTETPAGASRPQTGNAAQDSRETGQTVTREPQHTANQAAAAQPTPEPEPEPEPTPEPKPEPRPEPGSLAAQLSYHQEDWLATRPATQWFLQVTATSHEDGAQRVLDQLDGKGAYYRAKRGGKPVYLVLSGPYPSHDAAVNARESLPEALRQAGPFPREAADIQNELN